MGSGDFRITDLMKSRAQKNAPPSSKSTELLQHRKPRQVKSDFVRHESPRSGTQLNTAEMRMRDYWDLGLRFRWMILTWLLIGAAGGLYKGLRQTESYYATAKIIFQDTQNDNDESDFNPFVISADSIERLCKNDEILSETQQKLLDSLQNNPPVSSMLPSDLSALTEYSKTLNIEQLDAMLSLSIQGENKDILLLSCSMRKYQVLSPIIANSYCESLLNYLLKFTVIEYERQLAKLSLRIHENAADIKSIHSELKLLLDFDDGLTLNNNNRNLSEKFDTLKNQRSNLILQLDDKKSQISKLAELIKLNLEQQNIEDVVWINTNDINLVKLQNIQTQISELVKIYPEENPTLKQCRLEQAVLEKIIYPNKDLGVYYIVTDLTNNHIALSLREAIFQRKNLESNISRIDSSILKLVTQLKSGSDEQSQINKLTSRLDFLEDYRQNLHATHRTITIHKTATVTGYTVLEAAKDVNKTQTQPVAVTATLGLLGGLAFGVFLTLILYSFENSPKYSVDLRRKFSIPVLGVIPKWKDSIYLDPQYPGSTQTELYSILRNHIRFCNPNKPEKSIFIYSPTQNDGKTLTAINLAVAFSLENDKVLLISADLRVPYSLTELLPNPTVAIGICEILADESLDFLAAVHPSKVERLHVIPTVSKVNNPTKLLTGERFSQLLENMKQIYDVIIVDTPAILPVVDTASCIHLAHAAVMVVNAGKTSYAEITEALKRCQHVNAPTHGFILNGIKELSLEKFYGTAYKNQVYDDIET